MLKSLLKNALAVTVTLFPIAPAFAADTTDPLAEWVARVNKQIDVRLQVPADDATGIAQVTFRRGPDGRAVDIAAKGGHLAVAQAGVRTVKLLRHLPPLPAGMPADQRIVMNFLVGGPDTPVPFEAQRKQMLALGAASNAKLASTMSRTQVALLDQR